MKRRIEEGLFAGLFYEPVSGALGVDKFDSKTSALKDEGFGPGASSLVQVLFDRLDNNWRRETLNLCLPAVA